MRLTPFGLIWVDHAPQISSPLTLYYVVEVIFSMKRWQREGSIKTLLERKNETIQTHVRTQSKKSTQTQRNIATVKDTQRHTDTKAVSRGRLQVTAMAPSEINSIKIGSVQFCLGRVSGQ